MDKEDLYQDFHDNPMYWVDKYMALREAGDLLYDELRQWLATEHDAASQAAMQKWSALQEKSDE